MGGKNLYLILVKSKFPWTGQMKDWMKHNNMRPANIAELLTFGEKYPDEQTKYSIAALESIWLTEHKKQYIPILTNNGSKRLLGLHRLATNWYGPWRFLAVSNKAIKAKNLKDLPNTAQLNNYYSVYPVTVDYDETLIEMIEDGNYGNIHNNDYLSKIGNNAYLSTCDKPENYDSKVNLRKLYLQTGIYANHKLKKLMEYHDLRPANIAELLAFGAEYPDEQRKSVIVAIGSECGYANDYNSPALGMEQVRQKSWVSLELKRALYLNEYYMGFKVSYSDHIIPNYNPESRCYLVVCNEVKEDEKLEIEAKEWKVTVNYDLTFKKMIKMGRYDTIETGRYNEIPLVNKTNFPIEGKGKQDMNLVTVYFKGKRMYINEILLKLEKMNLRPANIAELLAFGAKYPNEQLNYEILALGSVWDKKRGNEYTLGKYAPFLGENKRKRQLTAMRFHLFNGYTSTRFLAAYKH